LYATELRREDVYEAAAHFYFWNRIVGAGEVRNPPPAPLPCGITVDAAVLVTAIVVMWPVAVDSLEEVINGRWHKARQVDPWILLRAIQGLLLNGLRLCRVVLWKRGNKWVPGICSGVTGSASGRLFVSPRLGRRSCSVVIVVLANAGSSGRRCWT
jgi:hypothetical protein